MEEAVRELISIFETIYEVKDSGKAGKPIPGNLTSYDVCITRVTYVFSSRHLLLSRYRNSRHPEGKHKLHHLHKLHRHSDFYQSGDGGNPSEIQVSRYQPRTNLAK